ncbi:hypothetical protein [Propionivibrio sp.]|uniref:hypothetical protein n=1 Tax=Propionivibrio sp. TaxID=2212460 RepID=UPI003BEFB92A
MKLSIVIVTHACKNIDSAHGVTVLPKKPLDSLSFMSTPRTVVSVGKLPAKADYLYV